MRNKRGQMKLSFGMIFSIILIVIFIVFAFYGIYKFLGYQKTIQVRQFVDSFQAKITQIWQGSQGSVPFTKTLPSKIEYVCFTDFSSGSGSGQFEEFYSDFELISEGYENNMFIYPASAGGSSAAVMLEHIDVGKITETQNPYCIKTIKGKVGFTIKIGLGDTLVTIE